MRISDFLLFIALLPACSIVAPKAPVPLPDSPTIVFSVFHIHRPSPDKPSAIQLLDTQASPGKLKKKSEAPLLLSHYLSLGIYRQDVRMDTLTIEHPLYKHIEYVNDQGVLALLDTILPRVEFFVRFQSMGADNEVRIYETVNNKRLSPTITIKN